MYPISPYLFFSELGVESTATNFDFIGINKRTGRPVIIEYLKRGEGQSDYITPLTSHPNKYIRQNRGKFHLFQKAQQILKAEIFYINYAFEDTYSSNGKVNFGEQIKVMKQIDIQWGREKNGKPDDIHTKDKIFKSFKAFDIWFKSFIEDNCIPWRSSIKKNARYSIVLNQLQAKEFLKEKNEEYLNQQQLSKLGISYERKLVMPDLGGDIFEDRLSFNLKRYALPFDNQFIMVKSNRFIFVTKIETDRNPALYPIEEIKKELEREIQYFPEHVRQVVIFNKDSEHIKYIKKTKNLEEVKLVTIEEYKESMLKLKNLTRRSYRKTFSA